MPLAGVSTHICKRGCTAVAEVWEGVDLKEDFKD